jgi:hypothetical protein
VSPFVLKTLVVLIPTAFAGILTIRTRRRLQTDDLLGTPAPTAFMIFLISRAIYWIAFGMLITAFALALLISPGSGEATRLTIAFAKNPAIAPLVDVMSTWAVVLVPLSLISIFVSIGALFLIGRAALRSLPEEDYGTPRFKRALATFFFMGFSLMTPPLFFSLLFSL